VALEHHPEDLPRAAGDLLATVRIVMPERVDDEFKDLMKTWRDKKPYDPRGGME